MKNQALRQFLVILFFLLILSPLFVMPFVEPGLSRGWQREFSIILGFVGLTMAGWQLAPISRFTPAQKLFNMDRLYLFHHLLSVVSAVFVTTHYLLLLFNFEAGLGINSWALALLNLFSSPLRAQMGVISLLAYLLITITSVFRKPMKLDYDIWRVLHDLFTLVLVGAGLTHALLVGRYTASPVMKTLLWIETVLWILAALYIRVIKPIEQLRHPFKIVKIREEVENAFTLVIEPQGFELPEFYPGQVAWLTVRRSPFSLRRHPFSISSSVKNRKQLEFTIKELGDFTKTVRDLQVGETIYIDGPFGQYDITDPKHKLLVLIVGGIGVAPAMSALRSMADQKDDRPVTLFYGNNHLDHLVFDQELKKLEEKMPNFKKVIILEEPPPGWDGYHGYISTEILRKELHADYKQSSYFVCGPLPMLPVIRDHLHELGISPRLVHIEKFDMA